MARLTFVLLVFGALGASLCQAEEALNLDQVYLAAVRQSEVLAEQGEEVNQAKERRTQAKGSLEPRPKAASFPGLT
jgi:hypothetical protein